LRGKGGSYPLEIQKRHLFVADLWRGVRVHPDLRVRACRYLAHFRRFGQAYWRNNGQQVGYNKADLENYEREIYPTVHQKMAEAFVGKPVAHGFEVTNSTWYKIHAA
jgi:hypothetical protein